MEVDGIGATDESNKLWRVFKTVNELLELRGYLVNEKNKTMTEAEFINEFNMNRDQMLLNVGKLHDENDKIVVFFPTAESLGNKEIQAMVKMMEEAETDTGIVVFRKKVTTQAKQQIAKISKYTIQMFHENELIVNIMNHSLVPRHVLLSSEDKRALLEKYKLKDSQLPRILTSDPVAKFLGLKRGQVVKIIRPSETAGRYVTYRLVV